MKVAILMSTYNGENYLQQQIDSIVNQDYSEWQLYIRDDGSTDDTLNIIETSILRDDRIHFIQDKYSHLGPKNSFLYLLKNIEADFYFFADQDDFWKSNKFTCMLKEFNSSDQPELVYCSLQCTNKDLKPIDLDLNKMVGTVSGKNRFIWNDIPGCTMAINSALRDKTINYAISNDNIVMHDWWLALIAEVFGKIKFVNLPLVLYRQHGNNVVGGGKKGSLLSKVLSKNSIKKQKDFVKLVYSQDMLFFKIYGNDLPKEYKLFFKQLVACSQRPWSYRYKFLKKYKLHTPSKIRTQSFEFFFVFELKEIMRKNK
ncbi:hypothetical protein BHU41_09320 [Lactobacillus crispatus]|uniref:Glycosyltransferase 2-like domain-containing protein n=1 Tax=Lactobacillus crispatus TaxID=47770 RepID=A0A2M9WMN2_9LACO|nr:glycosyltransferase family 2 protein [Lactobacillus crispatus]PJZ16662.1 hypothetical protein BHU41_09320 [Lactobacillus crispatus]